MLAVISDIHANLEAFHAVLEDIDKQQIKRIICLGDIVGYGPDPAACLTLARQRCAMVLRGNHDVAVLEQALGFNPVARNAIDWTRRQLKPGILSLPGKQANWHLLQNAPQRHEEEGIIFVHASPRDPVMEYIEPGDVDNFGFGPSPKVEANMKLVKGICMIGHTHTPGVIGGDYHWHGADALENGWRRDDIPAIVNVGSVGQPRDGDPRSAYGVLDEERIFFRRVPYDYETTIAKITNIDTIDNRLGERLRAGK